MSEVNSAAHVLHVIPESATRPHQVYLGSTKDVRCRTEFFHERGISYEELVPKKRRDENLIQELKRLDLSRYSAVIFEMPLYPRSLRYLKANFPNMRLMVRSINAEFYHRLHQSAATALNRGDLTKPEAIKKTIFYLRYSLTRLRLDLRCARHADYILSITNWEKEYYWKRIASPAKIKNLPYFLPRSYAREPLPSEAKKDQCVYLMSTSVIAHLPFNLDAAKNFMRIVDLLGSELPQWRFIATGENLARQVKMAKRVESVGFLDSPFPLLAESRILAQISDYGYGFKTKLLDAIAHKCYVLVPPKLYDRLPKEVHPFCILVKPGSTETFKAALMKSHEPYPEGDPNEEFRCSAYATLDELLLNLKNA